MATHQQGIWATLRAKCAPLLGLSDELVHEVCAEMETRTFARGEYLVRQGEPGNGLFVIGRGTAKAFATHGSGERHEVGDFVGGDVVGEISLVTRQVRTADVVAHTEVQVYQLARHVFDELVHEHPDLLVVLTNVVADRLGRASQDGLGGKDLHGHTILRCVGRGAWAPSTRRAARRTVRRWRSR